MGMPRHSTATFAGQEPAWQCHAATKRSIREDPENPRRCPQPVVPGTTVCRHHGGLGGRPGAGRWSKALGKLGQQLIENTEDPQLWDLTRTLGLLSWQVERAAKRVEAKDTPEFRRRCLAHLERLAPLLRDDPEAASEEMKALAKLVRQGVSEDRAFDELARTANRYQRSLERAWSQRLHRAEVMNRNDIRSMFAVIVATILEELPGEQSDRLLHRLDRKLLGMGADVSRAEARTA